MFPLSIRYGSDCSGIEAPLQALKKLKVDYTHVFSSDIDPYCQQSILANYSPQTIYDDITTRNHSKLDDIDLYVCGFPCQTFSVAGQRSGFDDPRGVIFWECMSVIKKKQPKIFLLENVRGLVNHDNGQSFETILYELSKLKKYKVFYKVLNSYDFGIPQSRERIYFLGFRKDYYLENFPDEFDWDLVKTKKLKSLESFIDYTDTEEKKSLQFEKLKDKIPDDSIFVDLKFKSNYINSGTICPCLNTSGGLYNVRMKRMANVKEYLLLQGFPRNFKQVVSDSQLKKQLGNSMTVNVLVEILRQALCL